MAAATDPAVDRWTAAINERFGLDLGDTDRIWFVQQQQAQADAVIAALFQQLKGQSA